MDPGSDWSGSDSRVKTGPRIRLDKNTVIYFYKVCKTQSKYWKYNHFFYSANHYRKRGFGSVPGWSDRIRVWFYFKCRIMIQQNHLGPDPQIWPPSHWLIHSFLVQPGSFTLKVQKQQDKTILTKKAWNLKDNVINILNVIFKKSKIKRFLSSSVVHHHICKLSTKKLGRV